MDWLKDSAIGPWVARRVLGKCTNVQSVADHDAYNYDDDTSWACLPTTNLDDAFYCKGDDMTSVPDEEKKADCFFLHPTGYFGREYNEPLHFEAGAEFTKMHTTTIAQPFSESCRVYAPYFRQQALAALYEKNTEIYEQSASVAFAGVLAAWKNFLKRRGDSNRPIVLVSHSQGSFLMVRLLQDHVDVDDEVAKKVVAVYALGGLTQRSLFDNTAEKKEDVFKNFHICRGPEDLHCLISFNIVQGNFANKLMNHIYVSGGLKHRSGWSRGRISDVVQVNPLTWTDTKGLIKAGEDGADEYLGCLSVQFNHPRTQKNMTSTVPMNWKLTTKKTMPPAGGAPLTAQVKGNVVSLGAFPFDALLPGVKTENDLHVHETQIFFYNIKANVNKRVKAYLAQQD